jgi:hypothetical protein
MANIPNVQSNTQSNNQSNHQATAAELTEIISELEQYRERLVHDTLEMAKKAKIMKKQAMTSLEPGLAQIDANLEALRHRLAAAHNGN